MNNMVLKLCYYCDSLVNKPFQGLRGCGQSPRCVILWFAKQTQEGKRCVA